MNWFIVYSFRKHFFEYLFIYWVFIYWVFLVCQQVQYVRSLGWPIHEKQLPFILLVELWMHNLFSLSLFFGPIFNFIYYFLNFVPLYSDMICLVILDIAFWPTFHLLFLPYTLFFIWDDHLFIVLIYFWNYYWFLLKTFWKCLCSVLSRSVVSDSLWPHGL